MQTTLIAANTTSDTHKLLHELIESSLKHKIPEDKKLKLENNTILLRLALWNLIKNFPLESDIIENKLLLLLPNEFDNFLKEELKRIEK